MKKSKIVLCLVLCAVVLTGCGKGDVGSMELSIVDSGDFSKSEVRHAMSLVSNYFAWHFEGCTMLELRYDAAESQKREQAEEGECIVLFSTFRTDGEGGDGSLNPNATYKNYQWILKKNPLGLWDLEDWGY